MSRLPAFIVSSALIISITLHASLVLVIIWQGKDFIKIPPKTPVMQVTATEFDPVKQAQAKQRQEEQKKQQQKQQAERNRQLEQQRKKQAEEQRRQEQVKQEEAKQEAAKQAAAKKKQQEEQKKQAEQKQQQERQQQEAQRQAEIAKQQAQQEKEAAARQEFMQQRQAEKAAQAEKDANAINDMKAVIFNLIANEWIRPLDILENLETTLEVQLLATGELLAVKIIKSSGNSAYDESTLNAFHAALPFPLMQLEPRQRDVFRKFTLTFAPEDLLSD